MLVAEGLDSALFLFMNIVRSFFRNMRLCSAKTIAETRRPVHETVNALNGNCTNFRLVDIASEDMLDREGMFITPPAFIHYFFFPDTAAVEIGTR